MINVPMVHCECIACGKKIDRPASDFDTDENLTCTCGEDYSTIALFIKQIVENE
jgi:hypothetical protein